LTAVPRAYPLVPRHEKSGVRRAPHGNYLIFYRVTADMVEILHVLHGARDYEPIVFLTRRRVEAYLERDEPAQLGRH
jgi:toxin ParE1/3/4